MSEPEVIAGTLVDQILNRSTQWPDRPCLVLERDTTPQKSGPGIGDMFPATLVALGATFAELHARKTGRGQHVGVDMYDSMLSLCERIGHQHSRTGADPAQPGNGHPLPGQDVARIFDDPHVAAKEMLVSVEHPVSSKPGVVAGQSLKFSPTPSGVYRQAPTLGEHNAEVLGAGARAGGRR